MSLIFQDPNVMDAASLVAVYGVRDALVSRKLPKLSNAAVIGVSQLLYNKFARSYIVSTIGTVSGGSVWTDLVGNTLGLAGALYLAKKAGFSSDVGESGLIPDPSGSVARSLVEAGELLFERRVAEYLLSSSGMRIPLIMQEQPQPAQVLNNGVI